MEYISVRDAAQKWNISERLVQKYCAMGRIDGAKKFGTSWEIPAGAVKPKDPRKEKNAPTIQRERRRTVSYPGLMPLMNTAFEPGKCLEFIQDMADGPKKQIALAEYYYFSGQPEKAVRETELFLSGADRDIQLSACLIYAYANLSVGQIQRARYALETVREMLASASEKQPEMRAALSFVSSTAAVLLHLPLPEKLPPMQEFLPMLPMGIRMFALYVNAHYTYLQKDYQKSLGIVEATLGMQTQEYPIPSIYLHLVAVMDYMSLKQRDKAKQHLLAAWDLARPDDLIEGFGEHHGLLGGMLEAVIKPEYPEDFKRIIAITYRFSSGWRKIHNPDTGHDVADNLTTTEFAASMLAARGWTNQEIASHMNISVNTVKWHVTNAMQKLNIGNRQDFKKYMLL
jgi:DNA-binding CsgD family transcriptional regulator